jgi:hypothetical protein
MGFADEKHDRRDERGRGDAPSEIDLYQAGARPRARTDQHDRQQSPCPLLSQARRAHDHHVAGHVSREDAVEA